MIKSPLCLFILNNICYTSAVIAQSLFEYVESAMQQELPEAKARRYSSPVSSGKNLILALKDMSEMLLASKSLLHVDTNHRNLYSIYI